MALVARHTTPDWKTNPEFHHELKIAPTKQLNLDRLVAEGYIATRWNHRKNKREYRYDQWLRWHNAKVMFETVRATLRDENEPGRTKGRGKHGWT